MAKCAESHIECGLHANQAAIFPQKIEFSLYFSLLLAETTSHETASTTNQFNHLRKNQTSFSESSQVGSVLGQFPGTFCWAYRGASTEAPVSAGLEPARP
jgi:hypothetical protein